MPSPLDAVSSDARARLRKSEQPEWIPPMLATLTDEPFSRPDWIFERKFDGERCLAFRSGDQVRLMSRNRIVINSNYPELVAAVREQTANDFIVDGEVVAFEGSVTSFERLQARMHVGDPEAALATGVRVHYYLFDLLHLDGYDTTRLTLRDRKALLRKAITFEDPLRWTTHRNAEGEAYHREACSKGWEGVIAKRAAGPYIPGRSTDWLKFKCVAEQELVIGGYTDPQGSRTGFGALLVGYYEGNELHYAGKVGTGFSDDVLRDLAAALQKLETEQRPFVERDFPRKGVHWVRPELVAQVGFAEWTADGRLRHPRYLGLRRDKRAADVVREAPRG